MANPHYRKRLVNVIRHAVQEYENAAEVDHLGIRGRVREIAVANLFEPLLPPDVAIGTGKVVDANGNTSPETDVIIYSKALLPPLLYNDTSGLFPIETTLFTIEVKSKLTSKELRDALGKGLKLQKKLNYISGIHDLTTGTPITHNLMPVYRVLFAFSSDLTGKPETEFERYERYENAPIGMRSIDAMCVVGRGTWSYSYMVNKSWTYQSSNKEYDEVIFLLFSVVNAIPHIIASRGHPMFGYYVYNNQEGWKGT